MSHPSGNLLVMLLLVPCGYLILSLARWCHPRTIVLKRHHRTPTFTLSFSNCGRYLSSGGTNDFNVWVISTGNLLPIRNVKADMLCDVTCSAWLTWPGSRCELVCYATLNGHVVLLEVKRNQEILDMFASEKIAIGDTEVTCLTVDDSGPDILIAVATKDSRVIIWRIDFEARKLSLVSSKRRKNPCSTFPKAVAFDARPRKDIYIFGVDDGILRKVETKNWEIIREERLDSLVGHADLDAKRHICAIDSVDDGIFVYKIGESDVSFIHALPCGTVTRRIPKVVKLFDSSRMIAGGSDHGLVYIFDTNSGAALAKLKHASCGGAEVIAAHDLADNMALIASASSSCSGDESSVIRLHYLPKNRRSFFNTVSSFIKIFAVSMAVLGVVAWAQSQSSFRYHAQDPSHTDGSVNFEHELQRPDSLTILSTIQTPAHSSVAFESDSQRPDSSGLPDTVPVVSWGGEVTRSSPAHLAGAELNPINERSARWKLSSIFEKDQ